MTQKVNKPRMFFSVITKTLNWDVFTNNLVPFERWDEVKDEKSDF